MVGSCFIAVLKRLSLPLLSDRLKADDEPVKPVGNK